MGYYYNIPLTNRKEKMTNKVDLNNIPENFVITYYAKKHKKIITRNGSWTKPTDFMTTGKAFTNSLDEANKFLSALTLLEDSKHITWHIVKHDFNEPLILTKEVA
jgi:hypothetical protein